MITGVSIHRYKSFHPTVPPPVNFEASTPPKPVFLYGTNGAGKSAIGEVIQGVSAGDPDFAHCQLATSNNAAYRVLVYNQRFVDKVIRTAEGVPGIFTLGVLDAETQAEIEKKKAESENFDVQLGLLSTKIAQSVEAGKKIQEVAVTGAWKAHDDYGKPPFRDLLKSYHGNRKKFFEDLEGYAVDDAVELDSLDRLRQRLADATSTETAKSKIALELSGLEAIEAHSIWLERIVVSSASRLAPLIEKWGNSDWVGQGREFSHGLDCPFCQQKLPEGFAEDLARLLDGDRQARLDLAQSLADRYVEMVAQIDEAATRLFEHSFAQQDEALSQAWQLLAARIKANTALMRAKIEKPAESVELEVSDIEPMKRAISAVNQRVTDFNARVANRAAELTGVRTMLWQVMRRDRAAVYDTYKASKAPLDSAIKAGQAEKADIEMAQGEISARLKELGRLQAGVGAAVEKINARLTNMGVTSFSIATKGGSNLYRLARPGQAEGDMSTLSEGEKTLISFLYFLECLGGSDEADGGSVDLGKTIAVIDDPISSLSHNFVFDIASIIHGDLIKPADGMPRPRQVIVLTHNLFFLHELLKQTISGKLTGQDKHCQLLRVVKPDYTKVLPMRASEMMNDYQALWQVLKDARDLNTPAIMVPNAMRCILEHFFWFTHQEDAFKLALKKVAAGDPMFTPLARFFDAAGFPEHYAANMGIDALQDAVEAV